MIYNETCPRFPARIDGKHLIFDCPKCGVENRHGRGSGRRVAYGHRVSHCDCWECGYYLVPNDAPVFLPTGVHIPYTQEKTLGFLIRTYKTDEDKIDITIEMLAHLVHCANLNMREPALRVEISGAEPMFIVPLDVFRRLGRKLKEAT